MNHKSFVCTVKGRKMGHHFWQGMAGLCASIVSAVAFAGMTPAELYAKISPSVWMVRTYDKEGLPLARGSAVVIGKDTLVTNCHVLRKASHFVVARDNLSLGATLELWDTPRDLCQIRARNLNAPEVRLASALGLVVGQGVFALGNPKGLELTFSAGLVSSLRRTEDGQLKLVQFSAPVSSGSSGGGLFDDQGRLIGLTTLMVAGEDAQNLNFAIPADWIKELPARHRQARKKEEEKKEGSAAQSAVERAGTTWNYLYRDMYGKVREIRVVAKSDGDGGWIEEATVGKTLAGTIRWRADDPLVRDRAADGIEWVEVSPFLFSNNKYLSGEKSVFELSWKGDLFKTSLCFLGEERITLGGAVISALKYEIMGEHPVNVPTGSIFVANAPNAFGIVVWYSKELGRVVRLSQWGSGGHVNTVREKYDISLLRNNSKE